MGISASRGGGEDSQAIIIGGLDIVSGLEAITYPLISQDSGNFNGLYLLGGGIELRSFTTHENPGTLTITNFTDEIISGTFEFMVLDKDGSEIRITDGRFDLKYAN